MCILAFLDFFFFLFLIDLVGDPLFFSIWPFLLPFVFHQILYESAIESVHSFGTLEAWFTRLFWNFGGLILVN